MLKQESSVEQYSAVHEQANASSEKDKSVRGHSLRSFYDFLNKNDPGLKVGREGDFAGLERIVDPKTGTALWTKVTKPEKIKEKLVERAQQKEDERRAEAEAEAAKVKAKPRCPKTIILL